MVQRESDYAVRSSLLLVCFFAVSLCLFRSASGEVSPAQDSAQHGDIEVTASLDAAEQSGRAAGAVKIHARPEVVWVLITDCAESLRLVAGLELCQVLETAPDRSWQLIRYVLNYSWFLPNLSCVVRATYDPPSKLTVERVSGDLRTLKGTWDLKREGDFTVVRYSVDLTTGFWVPHWLVLSALRHDLPKMLRALRARAEAIERQKPKP
jgi:ribosome-associated toxin RatA of RatAB toxin-antitoxin module